MDFAPSRIKVLDKLKEKGKMNFTQLRKETELSKPVLSDSINELKEKKLIAYRKKQEDKRKKFYRITKNGSNFLEKYWKRKLQEAKNKIQKKG